MTANNGTVVLTLSIEKEDGQFVGTCLELGTATCGDTEEETLENLIEAIAVHMEGLEEVGELTRVFEEKDITISPALESAETVKLSDGRLQYAVTV